MAKNVKVFVQICLHCVATVPGDKVPRPLGTQLHATKPNEILHFEFLYIALTRDGKYQYFLLLKNDLSGHLWLVPCRTAVAAATDDELMRWFAVFWCRAAMNTCLSTRLSIYQGAEAYGGGKAVKGCDGDQRTGGEKATRDRKSAIHNDKTHVRWPNFQVGDYVLVAEHRKSGVFKLQVKWKSPCRLANVRSYYVFVVENLLMKELKAAHATRLRFYKDKDLNVAAELAQAAENSYYQLYVVSRILDARYIEQEIFYDLFVS
jgi:hypothetical protein